MKTLSSIQKNREEEFDKDWGRFYVDNDTVDVLEFGKKKCIASDSIKRFNKQTTLALLESMVERLEGEKLKKSGVGYRHSTGSWVGENRGSGYNHALKNQIDYLTLQIKEIKL